MSAQDNQSATPENTTLIWDYTSRIIHWAMVLCFVFQWLTVEVLEGRIQWHMYGGYVMLALVTIRVVWGFVGPKYARFNNFLYRPKVLFSYMKTLFSRQSEIYAGHNPMGGLAIIIMLGLLLLQAVSGLFIDDEVFSSGPYYSAVSEQWQDLMSSVHHTVFDLLFYFVVLHVMVIGFYQHYKKQPLVAAMFHGRKPIAAKSIQSHKLILAVTIALLVTVAVYLVVSVFAPEVTDFYGY